MHPNATVSSQTQSDEQFVLVDIDGAEHRPFAKEKTRAVVLVFLLRDCPIANSYAPELNRIWTTFADRGVAMFIVYAESELTADEARDHLREYELQWPAVIDRDHHWAQRTEATRTPEAAVLSRTGELLYRGRIDDRYVDLGKRRNAVTSRDLIESLEAVLAGHAVAQPRTRAVGCLIP